MADEPYEGWAIVELMGHRRLAGRVAEASIAGGAFLRLDVPGPDEGDTATQFYAPGAVYCITPTSEEIARKVAQGAQPAPVTRWELERAAVRPPDRLEDDIPGTRMSELERGPF